VKSRQDTRRPFRIYVHPTFVLHPCKGYLDERSRGLIGFHDPKCTECSRDSEGYELWGENGHKQGGVSGDRADLVDYLRYRVQNEYYGRDSRYKTRAVFRRGRPVTYLG